MTDTDQRPPLIATVAVAGVVMLVTGLPLAAADSLHGAVLVTIGCGYLYVAAAHWLDYR